MEWLGPRVVIIGEDLVRKPVGCVRGGLVGILGKGWILEWAFQRSSHSTATRFQGMFGKFCWEHGETLGERGCAGLGVGLNDPDMYLPTQLIL